MLSSYAPRVRRAEPSTPSSVLASPPSAAPASSRAQVESQSGIREVLGNNNIGDEGSQLRSLEFGIIVQASVAERTDNPHLERVRELLSRFEHPLLDFAAQENGDSVQLIISVKNVTVPVHTYYFDLHPRDLEHPNFAWTFERQLYDCLHDYFIEMFERAPHTK